MMNVYTVQAGDTLESIAKLFLVSVTDLQKWNNGKFPSLYSTTLPLTPGWVINVSPPSRTTYNVTDFGAVGHDITRNDGSIIAGSTSFVSKDGTFKSGDVGTNITVDYAATNTTLSDMLIQGASYSLLTVNPLTTEIASGANVVVQFGTNTQTFVAAATAPVGAIYVTITAQVANYSYPIGSYVDPADLTTTITSVSSPTLITLGADATITAFGLSYTYTPDDTAAIQAAIDAAENVGGIVFLPPGTYLQTSAMLSISKPISFMGANRSSTVILCNNGLGVLTVNGTGSASGGSADNVLIEEVTLDTKTYDVDGSALTVQANYTTFRNAIVQGGTKIFAIYFVGPNGATGTNLIYNIGNTISNIILSDGYEGDGLSFSFQSQSVVSNVHHTGSRIAVYLCKDAIVQDYFWTPGSQTTSLNGFYISEPCSNIVIDNFTFEGTGSPIVGNSNSDYSCVDVKLSNVFMPNGSVLTINDCDGVALNNVNIQGTGYVSYNPAAACKAVRYVNCSIAQFQVGPNAQISFTVDHSFHNCVFPQTTGKIFDAQTETFVQASGNTTLIQNLDIVGGSWHNGTNGMSGPVNPTSASIHNLRGYNPTGPQTAPSMPASGAFFTNPFPFDATVYVSGGTVTEIAVGSTTTGLTSGSVFIPAGETITLTYSAAPTWVWIGN